MRQAMRQARPAAATAGSVPEMAASGDSAGGGSSVVWTVERVRALGLTTDLATAASILGFGRTLAFELLRNDEFPVPVLRAGRTLRVPIPALLALLGAEHTPLPSPEPADHGVTGQSSVPSQHAAAGGERWR